MTCGSVRLFQKLTKETPITSMPARKPGPTEVGIISVDWRPIATSCFVPCESTARLGLPRSVSTSLGREHAEPVFFFQNLGRCEARRRKQFRHARLGLTRVGRKAERERGGWFQDAAD